jgi:DNA-binding NarL/FixJ family response regulator
MTRTLLIVDDHESFASFVGAMLDHEGFNVVGHSPDGRAALVAAENLRPEIVLLDVQLPDIDGFEVAERLAELPNPPRVVLTSSREASDYGTRLTDTPATGFIPKRELSGEAIEATLSRAPQSEDSHAGLD